HVLAPGALGSCGIGSQVHLSFPVRASKPRTSPLGWSVALLSAIPEPTTMVFRTTAGGGVSSHSENLLCGMRRPLLRVMTQLSPKSLHGLPLAASIAIRRASIVAIRTLSWPFGDFQVETPRLAKSPYPLSRSILAS